jgi:hypothetical protein
MRLLYYPPQTGIVDDRIIGIGAHTEYVKRQTKLKIRLANIEKSFSYEVDLSLVQLPYGTC